jgi:hypothetical protein
MICRISAAGFCRYLLFDRSHQVDAVPKSRPKKRRRWFQISLRTLLFLFLLSGVLFGLIGPRLHYARQQKEAVIAIVGLGGVVTYDNGKRRMPGVTAVPMGLRRPPAWLLRLLGEDFFVSAVEIDFGGKKITNANLDHLEPLAHLQSLNLASTAITDPGLAKLKTLRRLEVLEIDNTSVTDVGLVHLSDLRKLRELDVRSTRVTEKGLLHLRVSPELKKLYIIDAQVTGPGVRQLREVFPNAKVYDRLWRTSGESYP